MLEGKRDVETVLTMGIMEDVSIIPQPAGNVCILKMDFKSRQTLFKYIFFYSAFSILPKLTLYK